MARQAERREATQGAILAAALRLFGESGFASVSVDEIAAAAGVAKGAVYHHFPSKEALFEAVFERAAEQLQQRVHAGAAGSGDRLRAMAAGARAYFEACAQPPFERIILKDGPAVLGWDRWREIDERYSLALVRTPLARLMRAGVLRERPVDLMARVVLAMLTEAGMAVAAASDRQAARRDAEDLITCLLAGFRTAPSS